MPADGEGEARVTKEKTTMAQLSRRELELVAIGAALGSNCVPCIEYHIPEAKKAGVSDEEIREAVLLADKVRKVPARKVLEAANRMLGGDTPDG
ncbi:carboxymuconolactone decarboxylase family protein [Microbulbifer sediminum]|uniref:carboxymuconolactone decarboxylase family protein n=1 Tax=Microbulbifer sediminum TaxID=2904250 RepID=UPI001F1FC8B9|nr:carboxymuconolactone decarboxylase family protein [Microbulbifer sediminum]